MKRHTWHLMTAALLAALVLGKGEVVWGVGKAPLEGGPPQPRRAQQDNLLVNGSMEEGFYWKYPNHYVANGWLRWWVGDGFPEYADGGKAHSWDGKHSQRYHRWGVPYTAGIFQRVNVERCAFYQFSVYGRNHSGSGANHHARVGIDPLGRGYGKYMSSLPSDIVWSPEQTFLLAWGLHTVTAESLSDYITAITYASPDAGYGFYDTFWDAGSLVQVPGPEGRLPAPDSWTPSGFIQNLTSPVLDKLVIAWDTPQPASTQVWYNITSATAAAQSQTYEFATPVDVTRTTHHQVVINGLKSGDTVDFAALSRRLVGDRCVTEVFPQSVTVPRPTDRVPEPDSWTPSGAIRNLSATPSLGHIFVTWDTDFASTTQVWYNVSPAPVPITPTGTLSYTVYVYLPMVSTAPNPTQYEFATRLDLTPVTHHRALIKGLKDGDTVRFVALSSRIVDNRVVTEVSDSMQVADVDVPPITQTYLPVCLRGQ